MRDIFHSASQIQNAAGSTFADAQFAAYMAQVAGDWTISTFAEKIGLPLMTCREAAYRWGVRFPDYDPFAKPKRLEWRKAKKGWDLIDGESVIGECRRQSDGKYLASLFSQTSVESWDARQAMRVLTLKIDAMSPDLPGFNGLPVKSVETNEHGLVFDTIFPPEADKANVRRCRDALDYRATVKAAA